MFIPEYLRDVYQLFYPKNCGACGTVLVKNECHICISCYTNLPFTHFHLIENNPIEKVFIGRTPIVFATSLLYFSKHESVQRLLHQIKYNGKKYLAVYLGNMLGDQLKNNYGNFTFDGIVPVPLHPKKERLRGYNQSNMIAKGVAESLDIPIWSNSLKKTQFTATQTYKNREERWQNIRNTFSINNSSVLKGKHILLIDDVLTTGATLESIATPLQELNDVKISIATLAYTF